MYIQRVGSVLVSACEAFYIKCVHSPLDDCDICLHRNILQFGLLGWMRPWCPPLGVYALACLRVGDLVQGAQFLGCGQVSSVELTTWNRQWQTEVVNVGYVGDRLLIASYRRLAAVCGCV